MHKDHATISARKTGLSKEARIEAVAEPTGNTTVSFWCGYSYPGIFVFKQWPCFITLVRALPCALFLNVFREGTATCRADPQFHNSRTTTVRTSPR